MNTSHYSSIAPNTVNVSWEEKFSVEKGDHSQMSSRTDASSDSDSSADCDAGD